MAKRLRRVINDAVTRVPVRTRWVAATILGAASLLWLVLVVAPPLFYPTSSEASLQDVTDAAKRHELQNNRLRLQNDVRTTLLQGLGGLAVLVGAFVTYQQVQTNRRQLRHAVRSATKQRMLDQKGQVTERFTRAIDQLGNKNVDMRLGGLYALERIAHDSPDDRATIAEILVAFVCGHAPWPPARPGQYVKDAAIEEVPELRFRAPDVQAALTVLWRNHMLSGLVEPDLRAADLRCADLRDAELQGAHLYGAHLQGANLTAAKLQGADLRDAELQEAYLGFAHLRRARLEGAQLQGAHNLRYALLRGVLCDSNTVWPKGLGLRKAGVFCKQR
jgi:hypothetical protein